MQVGRFRMLGAMLGLTLGGQVAIFGGEEGLVAHYTFDEGPGAVVKDHSGCGNDGRIHNAVFVPSPRGQALQFNGQNSYVECGTNAVLNIRGDLTFEAWVKVPTDVRGDKYLFGDNAGLAINRNFIVCADNLRLRLEHGNGMATESVTTTGKVFDGTWQHIAVVCEEPCGYMFLNGQQVVFEQMSFPITPTAPTEHRIGGWFWDQGYFKGEIDEIKVYRRALPEKTIREHASLPPKTADVSIQKVVATVHYPRQELAVKVFCQQVATGQQSVVVKLLKNGGKPVLHKEAPVKETRPGSERGLVEVIFDTKAFEPGGYLVQVFVNDTEGRIVAEAPVQPVVYPEKPEWFGSRAGISDQVLPPYTPIQVDRQQENVAVQTWGRSYRFAPGLFLSGIRSQEKELLAGAMRLSARADGRELAFPGAAPSIRKGPAQTTLIQNGANEAVQVSVKTMVEYDGLARMDLELKALRPVTIENLTVEIPLDARSARYLYLRPYGLYGSLASNGLLTKDQYDFPFQSMFWLGDEEKGLSWVAESNQNWRPAIPTKAIQILKDQRTVTFRMNLIGQPVKMEASKPIAYTFGLQATPLKPIRQDAWDFRIYRLCRGPYGNGQENTLFLRVPDSALDDLTAKGIRTITVFEEWTQCQNYTRTEYEADLERLVKRCHQRGMKVTLYFGYLISDMIPEWPYLGDDCVTAPRGGLVGRLPYQNEYRVCLRSAYQDLLVDGIARLMDRFDIDGVYLDTTTIPYDCINRLHGCGYHQEDGALAATCPVFNIRDTFKRIYTVVKQRKPDGIVEAHVYDCMNSPALAFATSYWNGEQLLPYWNGDPKTPKGHLPDFLPLDRFRAEMMGYNWGVPAEFLYQVVALGSGYRPANAITLLHGVRCGVFYRGDALDLDSQIGKLLNDFGRREAKFLPYWNNGDCVTVQPADCQTSLYQHPRNGVLVILSNLGKREAEVAVKLDLARLQLGGALTAIDGLTGQPLEMKGGQFVAKLPSVDWKIVWIKPAK